jgi:hypothetical protein
MVVAEEARIEWAFRDGEVSHLRKGIRDRFTQPRLGTEQPRVGMAFEQFARQLGRIKTDDRYVVVV